MSLKADIEQRRTEGLPLSRFVVWVLKAIRAWKPRPMTPVEVDEVERKIRQQLRAANEAMDEAERKRGG